jgi:hypothetical protein
VQRFNLPSRRFGAQWTLVLTTFDPEIAPGSLQVDAGGEVTVAPRSLVLLRRAD